MTKRLLPRLSAAVSPNLWAVYHGARDDFSSDSLVSENRSADGGELRALMHTWTSCDFTMTPLTVFLHKQPSHCRPRSTKPPSGLNPTLEEFNICWFYKYRIMGRVWSHYKLISWFLEDAVLCVLLLKERKQDATFLLLVRCSGWLLGCSGWLLGCYGWLLGCSWWLLGCGGLFLGGEQ